MGVVVYGHYGAPILAFPTSGGDEWEHEGQGMIGTLAPFIDAGRIKVFTVGAVTAESFYNAGAHPFHRSWMQSQYDAYIRREVIPFIHTHCQGAVGVTTMGASLGAYHAANTLLKHPDVVKRCYAMSGVYDMKRFMDGLYDDNLYFNNPVDYAAEPERSVGAGTAGVVRDQVDYGMRAVRTERPDVSAGRRAAGARDSASRGRLGAKGRPRLAVLASSDVDVCELHVLRRRRDDGGA